MLSGRSISSEWNEYQWGCHEKSDLHADCVYFIRYHISGNQSFNSTIAGDLLCPGCACLWTPGPRDWLCYYCSADLRASFGPRLFPFSDSCHHAGDVTEFQQQLLHSNARLHANPATRAESKSGVAVSSAAVTNDIVTGDNRSRSLLR